MFCTNCGYHNDEQDAFCANCGQVLHGAASETQEPTNIAQTQVLPSSTALPTSSNDAPQPMQFAQMPNGQMPNSQGPNGPMPSAIAPTGQASNVKALKDKKPLDPKKKRIAIIAAIVAVVLVLASAITTYALGVWKLPWQTSQIPVEIVTQEQLDKQRKAEQKDHIVTVDPKSSKSSSDTKKSKKKDAKDSKEKESKVTLNKDSMESIVSPYGNDAAVSVVYGDEPTQSYDSSNARTHYTAAGFYAGVYAAALYKGAVNDTARTMMASMDNAAANDLIGQLGGRDAVNSILAEHGYQCTGYGRDFGDTKATADNLSCAADASRALMDIAKASQSNVFGFDLASEGIVAPEGVTLYGHRGQGINNAYDFFVIAQKGDQRAVISVFTNNRGKDSAVALTNSVLSQLNTDVFSKQDK